MSLAWDKAFFDPEGDLRNGWKAVAFLLLLTVANQVAFTGLSLWPWLRAHDRLPVPLLLFLICLLVTRLFLKPEDQPLASIGLRANGAWFKGFALGALGGGALMAVTALTVCLTGGMHFTRAAGAGLGPLLAGAWLYLGVALNEELLYRGFLFQRLERGLGAGLAQLAIASLFAFSHWANPGMAGATKFWATLNIALASLLLGLCYLRTRSLALPMGVHLGWNWVQGSLLGFGVSGTGAQGWWQPVFHGRPEWLTGGSFGLEASLPCALWCALACLLLARLLPTKPWADAATTPQTGQD